MTIVHESNKTFLICSFSFEITIVSSLDGRTNGHKKARKSDARWDDVRVYWVSFDSTFQQLKIELWRHFEKIKRIFIIYHFSLNFFVAIIG